MGSNPADIKAAIFTMSGRPCVVTDTTHKTLWVARGVRRTVQQHHVRFLDGAEPRLGIFNAGAFGKQAKQVTGQQARVWRRADDLAEQGMEATRAYRQAVTEVAQGVRF